MRETGIELAPPDEPLKPRAEARALLEGDPEEGMRLVRAGYPLADLLWEEWGEELEEVCMDRERYGKIVWGYSDEIRLWVMGERIWEHCVAGLAGRLRRRVPQRSESEQPTLAGTEACR